MQLGAHCLRNGLFVAPMAGVTDRPFRTLCRRFGAALAASEMVSSQPELRASRKSRLRREHAGEPGPVAVQIAGADPALMADAARRNVDEGAQIIDINMGCPAKKVCNVAAGSALLENEPLVARVLEAVVAATGPMGVPVTLKIRTGPNPGQRNALSIARLAEQAGVRLLAIHGRTRACAFRGQAEYDTIAEVKSRLRIPVIANGDIATPEDAKRVLAHTRADGVMIGRAAHGRPWIFAEFDHFLATGGYLPPMGIAAMRAIVLEHLEGLYALYGELPGLRIARKHIGWYVKALPGGEAFRREANRIESAAAQRAAVAEYYARLAEEGLATSPTRSAPANDSCERLAA